MYSVPSITAESEKNKEKIYKLIKDAARFARSDYCFRESIRSITNNIGIKMPEEIVEEGSARFVHNIVYQHEPKELIEMIKFPRTRSCVDLNLQYIPKTERLRKCAMFKGIQNYNQIPQELKHLEPRKLKKKMKTRRLNPKRQK